MKDFLIDAIDIEEAFVKVFWVFAEHIGEAINIVKSYLSQLDLIKYRIAEVEPFNWADLPTNTISK